MRWPFQMWPIRSFTCKKVMWLISQLIPGLFMLVRKTVAICQWSAKSIWFKLTQGLRILDSISITCKKKSLSNLVQLVIRSKVLSVSHQHSSETVLETPLKKWTAFSSLLVALHTMQHWQRSIGSKKLQVFLVMWKSRANTVIVHLSRLCRHWWWQFPNREKPLIH